WLEYRPVTPGVAGSRPVHSAKKKKRRTQVRLFSHPTHESCFIRDWLVMFEYIRSHQRLMMLLLLLIIFPSFAFFGLESYMSMGDARDTVAKVDGKEISQQELDAAQREQRERMRQMFGDQFDASVLETPEARKEILDDLIARRVLAAEARRNLLTVSDRGLQETIG